MAPCLTIVTPPNCIISFTIGKSNLKFFGIIFNSLFDDKKKYKINKSEEKIVSKNQIKIVDVCTILEKCSIDEISKYLLEQGKKKDFPDITQR